MHEHPAATAAPTAAPLSRHAPAGSAIATPAPPVRIVHIGLGAFHRAHQAWYTARATDAADWGIAAFTGRSPVLAEQLAAQDGLFTLVERGADGDRFEVIGSIVEAHPGADVDRLVALIAAAPTALITLTVTEAGYCLGPDGLPDTSHPDLAADLVALSSYSGAGTLAAARPHTVPARLLVGLENRRLAGGGELAVVPCDNFPGNGPILRASLLALAAGLDPDLAEWVAAHVSFVSTSVDRITPRVEDTLADTVAEATGYRDAAPVAAEPFADWTLSGDFPAGRPAWESAGARFVDGIEPYEARKLWMLNGAHSLLAYDGRLRGHTTVAAAMDDPACVEAVEAWWDEAARHLPDALDAAGYRRALVERFRNPRIEHRLEQISSDGLTKIGLRIAPVARLERDAGRPASASAVVVASWIAAVLAGMPLADALGADVARAAAAPEPVGALLRAVAADLADDTAFAAEVSRLVAARRAAASAGA